MKSITENNQQDTLIDQTITNLEDIANSTNKLTSVQSDLKQVLDAIDKNPSFIQKMVNSWKNFGIYGQYAVEGATVLPGAAGLALKTAGLIFVPGIAIGSLATFSAFSFFVYMALDDYIETNDNKEDIMRKGLISLSEVLDVVICSLDNIRVDLAKQVDAFKNENLRLINNIDNFQQQLGIYVNEIETLKTNINFIKNRNTYLEACLNQTQISQEKNELLLEEQRQDLMRFKQDEQLLQINLDAKIMELNICKTSMGLELEKAKKVSSVLQHTVQTLSNSCIQNETDRESIQIKMDALFKKEEADFDCINEKFSNMECTFSKVLVELQENNLAYKELLKQEEEKLKMINLLTASTSASAPSNNYQSMFGFFTRPLTIASGIWNTANYTP